MIYTKSNQTKLIYRKKEDPSTSDGDFLISKVYYGSNLVYGYEKNKVIFEKSTAGTYSLTISAYTIVQAILVGGGSGGVYVYSSKFSDGSASGGSGGYLNINMRLYPGTYSITVGSGGSSTYINNSSIWGSSSAGTATKFNGLTAGAGGGATACAHHVGTMTAGSGGSNSYSNSNIIKVNSNTSGASGSTGINATLSGGASRYGGYGKGGDAAKSGCTSGGSGYIKLTAISIVD